MNDDHVVAFDDPDHHHSVQRLLPWFANGTLDEDERERVESHLQHCALCSAELLAQRTLRDQLDLAGQVPSPDASWRRLQASLSAADPTAAAGRPGALPGAAPPVPAWRRVWQALMEARSGIRMVLAVQAALVLVMATLLWRAPADVAPALYVTRSAAPAAGVAGERILVSFDAAASIVQLRHALRAVDGRISEGPTETGVCVLEVPAGTGAAALTTLRAEPGVRLAESLGPGSAR